MQHHCERDVQAAEHSCIPRGLKSRGWASPRRRRAQASARVAQYIADRMSLPLPIQHRDTKALQRHHIGLLYRQPRPNDAGSPSSSAEAGGRQTPSRGNLDLLGSAASKRSLAEHAQEPVPGAEWYIHRQSEIKKGATRHVSGRFPSPLERERGVLRHVCLLPRTQDAVPFAPLASLNSSFLEQYKAGSEDLGRNWVGAIDIVS